jgi:cardiolipin synthase (CMP-forming)
MMTYDYYAPFAERGLIFMSGKHMQGIKNLGIPNMLSVLRLIMIPFFVYYYLADMQYSGIIAAAVLVLSGATDVVDGIIARKFNMITDLGRILDPFADKLTQATVCTCLVVRRVAPFWILFLLILKELVMIGVGANIIRKGKEMMSSKWFGKMATVVFYAAMTLIIALRPTRNLIDILLGIVLAFMFFSLIMYIPSFLKIFSKKGQKSG